MATVRLAEALTGLDHDGSADALQKLQASGIHIITIANFSPAILRGNADAGRHLYWSYL
jgi:hypothetical protein